jgi:Cof subfamily protein (haloacid dehalogenase superfamily)
MSIKLVAIDLDGTLLTDDYKILPQSKAGLKLLQQADIGIIICTGRGPNACYHIMDELQLEGYYITHNGGVTLHYPGHEIYSINDMTRQELEGVISFCREKSIHFDVSTPFHMYIEGITPAAEQMYQLYRVEPILRPSIEGVNEQFAKFTLFAEESILDKAYPILIKKNPHLRISRSGKTFIDVLHPNATKEIALKQYCDAKGIAAEEVVAIGNYFNDIGMLHWAGLGIAMANSPDEVIRAADKITEGNNEFGILKAIKEFILPMVTKN